LSGSGFSQHVAVVDLGADYMPTGAPRRVTRRPIETDGGYSWTRDGRSIVYVEWGVHRLWRVEVTGDRAAEPVEIAGFGAIRPATAAGRDRLVFVKEQHDTDIYRFEVGRPAEPVITSTAKESNPQFSPDGRRVAFESERSGEHEIWLAGNDGSSPQQLTHGPGLMQRFARWSPNGRRIAFDSRSEEGVWSIWTIDVDGASARRPNQDTGNENFPDWSRDGRFIYFTKGSSGIWRLPVAGGVEEQITQDGLTSSESIDGKTLFFVRDIGEAAPLWAQPLDGGPQRQIAACMGTGFAVGPGGVYAMDCRHRGPASLFLRDPTTGQGRLLGKLERDSQGGLTVSPDGKTFLYTRVVSEGSNLMMIENFR
jgi:Tol biopolymer transport system component